MTWDKNLGDQILLAEKILRLEAEIERVERELEGWDIVDPVDVSDLPMSERILVEGGMPGALRDQLGRLVEKRDELLRHVQSPPMWPFQ